MCILLLPICRQILKQSLTDLDKLLYFMKLSDTITDKKQLPKFHKEGWLKQTLDIIDVSSLSKEELTEYEKSKEGRLCIPII